MGTLNWDYIVSMIESEMCILVLGPEVLMKDDKESIQSKLIKHLNIARESDEYVSNHPRIKKYYPQDDFFLFGRSADRTMICYEIKAFFEEYAKDGIPDTLKKIAQIPFHTILTVSPDLLMKSAFEELNIKHQFAYHKKKSEPQAIEMPEKGNPFVYNMFGSVADHESLVLTHEDMFSYLESIFGRNTLPEKLKSALVKAENLIFLGVPFDKWYMQLLLRLLDVNDDSLRFAANEILSEDARTFYVDQFKMDFVNNEFTEFANELFTRCHEKGILRKESAPSAETASSSESAAATPEAATDESSTFEEILDLIAEGNLDKLFETLTDFFASKSEDLRAELSVIKGKYKRFVRWRRSGALSFEEFDREITKMTDGILELVRSIRK